MKEALDKYEAGETTAYKALVEYVGYATKYANLEGYDDYLAYAYENVYDRDYQYADTDTLKTLISQYIVPINEASWGEIAEVQYYVFNENLFVKEWNNFVYMLNDFYGTYFDYFAGYQAFFRRTQRFEYTLPRVRRRQDLFYQG